MLLGTAKKKKKFVCVCIKLIKEKNLKENSYIDILIYIIESFDHTPKTNMTLYISHTELKYK